MKDIYTDRPYLIFGLVLFNVAFLVAIAVFLLRIRP